MWLVSCMSNHKLDPEVSKEEFKKFANSTGLLICIEDIKNFKKLQQILAWQYDDNMTYRNKEVSALHVSNAIMSIMEIKSEKTQEIMS